VVDEVIGISGVLVMTMDPDSSSLIAGTSVTVGNGALQDRIDMSMAKRLIPTDNFVLFISSPLARDWQEYRFLQLLNDYILFHLEIFFESFPKWKQQ
jgi:hypothetical protein